MCKTIATIRCDFDEDQCGFTTKSEGNDASKKGFNWVRHSASWVTSNEELEGPGKGINVTKPIVLLIEYFIIYYLQSKIKDMPDSFLRSQWRNR